MNAKTMTCINCPMGCQLTVEQIGDEISVKGNTCARGAAYGKQEYVLPKRMLTSLVRVKGGGVVSVKLSDLVPKDKLFDILAELKPIEVSAPVKIGDVIIPNVLGLGVDVIATKNI